MAWRTMRRHTFRRGVALTGSIALLSGCLDSLGGGGDDETQSIRLGGDAEGWEGEEPPDIEGETNPTLSLQAGTTYELTWENLDGEEHEIIIEDEEGNEFEASDESDQEDETVTMTFDATEEMAAYYCEYHPEAMRGEISVE